MRVEYRLQHRGVDLYEAVQIRSRHPIDRPLEPLVANVVDDVEGVDARPLSEHAVLGREAGAGHADDRVTTAVEAREQTMGSGGVAPRLVR